MVLFLPAIQLSLFLHSEMRLAVHEVIAKAASIWFILSAGFFLATLIWPIGDVASPKDRDRRLFLGIPSIPKFLQARDAATFRCLIEMILMLILTILGASVAMYALYVWQPAEAVKIACELKNHIHTNEGGLTLFGGIFCFIYFSLVTFTTTGYGDITPVSGYAIGVITLQLAAGSVFIIGIIPPLLALVGGKKSEALIEGVPSFGFSSTERAIKRGLSWLQDNRSNNGSWSGLEVRSSPGIVCVALALQSKGEKAEAASLLNPAIRNEISASPLSMALCRIFDHEGSLTDFQAKDLLSSPGLNDEQIPLALLFGVATGKMQSSLLGQMVPNLSSANWEREYGEHWGTYALVADFLTPSSQNYASILSKLLSRRNRYGSFYGDVILTSLIACSLIRGGGRPRAWGPAADATCWLKSKRPELTTPPFDSLGIWDTGWGILTLRQLGLAYEDVAESISWLQKTMIRKRHAMGWSWSTESSVLCLDSTSLICESLIDADFADVVLTRTIRYTLDGLSQHYLVKEGMWPTFVDENSRTEPCPIITARVFSLLRGKPEASAHNWSQLLTKVISGETSYWFTDGAITKGFVLYYASKSVGTNSPECESLFTDLEKLLKGSDREKITLEGKLSALIGCTAYVYYANVSETERIAYIKTLRQVIDTCILMQCVDGCWNPQEVGRFGFGIHYADRVFTTCLGIIALNNFRQLTHT